jgi:tRNA-Thr(GGU) m(6)t(6)A37 methyltransferase TsaA
MTENQFVVQAIGVIHSELIDLADAPKQGDEGSYEARLELDVEFAQGLAGIRVGDELIILTWLHLAQRAVLQVRPRDRAEAPLTGVFATRSQDRPNPIGLHQVTVLTLEGNVVTVAPLEAIDGTPILDLKPVLLEIGKR